MLGYILALLSMISFGLLGIFHKLADRQKCTPFMITVVLFTTSTCIMAVWVLLFKNAQFAPPNEVIAVAIPFGLATVISLWVFQYGIRFGKITTSWVIINLSAAVPTIASTLMYNEPLGLRKVLILVLIAASILLLWKDRQLDELKKAAGVVEHEGTENQGG
jgi:drug/metabolite transporter (DMT)-like permease